MDLCLNLTTEQARAQLHRRDYDLPAFAFGPKSAQGERSRAAGESGAAHTRSLACAAIIAAGSGLDPDRRVTYSKGSIGTLHRYMEIGGTSLRVRITGPQHAPAVLLLHGFGSVLKLGSPGAELSDAYQVVRFDLPGCGMSEADRNRSYGDARSLELVKGRWIDCASRKPHW